MAGSQKIDAGGNLIRQFLFDMPPEPGAPKWVDSMPVDLDDAMVDAGSLESATGIPTHNEQVGVPISRTRQMEMDNIPVEVTQHDPLGSTAKVFPKNVWKGLLPEDMNNAWWERFQRLNTAMGENNAFPVLHADDLETAGKSAVDFNISGTKKFDDATGVYRPYHHDIFMNAEGLPGNDMSGAVEYVGDHTQVARHELFHSLVDSIYPRDLQLKAREMGVDVETLADNIEAGDIPSDHVPKLQYIKDMNSNHTPTNWDPTLPYRVSKEVGDLLNFFPTLNDPAEFRNAINQLKQQTKVAVGKDIGATRQLSDDALETLMVGDIDYDNVFNIPSDKPGFGAGKVLRSETKAAVGPQEGNILHGYENNRAMIKEIYDNGTDEIRSMIKDMFYMMGDNRNLLNGLTEEGESYG